MDNYQGFPGTILFNFDATVPLEITFSAPTLAFAADFTSGPQPLFTNFTATLTLSGGEKLSFECPTASLGVTFFGFVADTPITSLIFSDGGRFGGAAGVLVHQEIIQNIRLVQVPEPDSVMLCLTALAVALGRRVCNM